MRTAIILICAILFLMAIAVPASASNQPSQTALFIETTIVPEEAIEYACTNAYRFMCSSIYDGGTNIDSILLLQLGSPFALTNTESGLTQYYFPVFDDNCIIATLRVYSVDGVYYGIYSSVLVDELNALITRTSAKAPARLSVETGNLMVTIDGKKDLLWECPPRVETEIRASGASSSKLGSHSFSSDINERSHVIINCFDSIEFEKSSIQEPERGINSFPPYRYLGFAPFLIETQGQEPWCTAYVTAFIVRYLDNDTTTPTAASVMAAAYPNKSNEWRLTHMLPDPKAVAYYNSCGFLATLVLSQISDSAVRTAIVGHKPIHLLCSEVTTFSNHSLALVGYNDITSILRIWNPWYDHAEDMDDDTKIYAAGNGEAYEWMMTITIY